MKIEEIELRRIRLELVTPFQTSFGTETERDVLLVRVAGPDGEGWGECVALTEPVYSPEYVEGPSTSSFTTCYPG
jgi:O-succinylbenzoate synthase